MERIRLEGIDLQQDADNRQVFRCRFVKAGLARAAGGGLSDIELPAEVLARATPLFVGKASFVDHAGWEAYPSLRSLVGVVAEASWNPSTQSVDGLIRLYDTATALAVGDLLRQMLADEASGQPVPDVGLSIVFYPEWATAAGPAPKGGGRRVADIRHVESVDFVFEPAADGRVLQALSAAAAEGGSWRSYAPQQFNQTVLEEEGKMLDKSVETNQGKPIEMAVGEAPAQEPAPAPKAAGSQAVPLQAGATPQTAGFAEWQAAMASAAANSMLAASGLPDASVKRLASQAYATPEEVARAIEAERAYLASLQQAGVVQVGGQPPRSPGIVMGLNGYDELRLALEALLMGRTPQSGVRPLSGIREAYTLLSGDYEMSGLYHPERVQFANVNCSTMAGLVANALNKSVINMFQSYPRWWEPITLIQDFSSLQQIKWITLGGVGELPTVNEGAAYTEMTWDDQTETADFVKKGGYLGITLEAIDKDDTNRLQAAPRAIAQAAWLALSKSMSGIFTSGGGVGPTMSDAKALFHVDHANLGSTALSWAAWNATRILMRKHAELNSAERLGALTAPKFLLVPPDLEGTALQLLATESQPAQANYNENVYAEGSSHDARMAAARNRVIVIDLWTDATDWVAVADPNLYPTLGLGFRYGREPEIFSVASPTAGLMFSNDTMPVKARFFYACGPLNWRGLYKHAVAG